MRAVLFSIAILVSSGLALSQEREGRSFVGKKLPEFSVTDTEGYAINTRLYAGSVLVMITGIPW